MNNFGEYITAKKAAIFESGKTSGSAYDRAFNKYERLIKRGARKCENCDEREWLYGQVGLCFSCTTGEADASGDYELQ